MEKFLCQNFPYTDAPVKLKSDLFEGVTRVRPDQIRDVPREMSFHFFLELKKIIEMSSSFLTKEERLSKLSKEKLIGKLRRKHPTIDDVFALPKSVVLKRLMEPRWWPNSHYSEFRVDLISEGVLKLA